MPRAKKSFGQHFLRDKSVINKIIMACDIQPTDTVIEIGPGTGALTTRLAELASELVLVEADRELVPALTERFPQAKIIIADAAKVDYQTLLTPDARRSTNADRSWILVGNLPYNAANAIIMNALTSTMPPRSLVVMVQKEVGEKMLAKPGEMSLLSVAVQMYATVERICLVKPGAFVPPPKVDSLVLRLTPKSTADQPESVIALAKTGFSSKRKQLHRNLADSGVATSDQIKSWLTTRGLSPLARAEELSLADWISLRSFPS